MRESSDIHGSWHLVMRTPVGTVHADVVFGSGPIGITGRATSRDETVALADITAVAVDAGQRVTWTQTINRPMRLRLAFDVVVSGDELIGSSRAGRLPRSLVNGTRNADPVS